MRKATWSALRTDVCYSSEYDDYKETGALTSWSLSPASSCGQISRSHQGGFDPGFLDLACHGHFFNFKGFVGSR